MTEKSLPERMRGIALDIPDDMTNREYWLRTEIMQWADELDADLKAIETAKLSNSLRSMGL